MTSDGRASRARWSVTTRLAAVHPASWLVLLLPAFAWAALTYPGYFELHSGFLPVFNLNDFARHLSDLAWAPAVGQSYDLLRGERALPYLLALPPKLLGASATTAIKWVLGISIWMGALGMYGWARRRMGEWPGLVAALVYAFWPLGLTTIYLRGAFAEAVLLGLAPWVAWAADSTLDRGRWTPAAGLALGIAATLWTQTGLALWLALLILVFILVRPAEPTAERGSPDSDTGSSIVEGRGLRVNPRSSSDTLWFTAARGVALGGWLGGFVLGWLGLLPLILQRGAGGASLPVFADHLVYLHELLLARAGGSSALSSSNGDLTAGLGLVACGLAAIGLALPRPASPGDGTSPPGWTREPAGRLDPVSLYAIGIVIVLVCLGTVLATPFWKLLPFLSRTLTYPWQLILLAGPWLAWLAGVGGRRLLGGLPERHRDLIAVSLTACLCTLALLDGYSYLTPDTISLPVPDAPLAIFGDNEIALLSARIAGDPGPGREVAAVTSWQ